MDAALEQALAEQQDYYRARAAEYEDWWFRRGRYDHGESANAAWFADVEQAQASLDAFVPAGDVLELACGTGLWTERLLAHAQSLTAVDSSVEALALARRRAGGAQVEWLQADLFAWEPQRRYDVCFFGFWLSHVPGGLFAAFWEKVARALAPGGRVWLVDSAVNESASARDHDAPVAGERLERRRLHDGREFQIVKHWFEAPALQRSIEQLGWSARIESSSEYFVYGEASSPPGYSDADGSPAGRDGV